MTLLVYLRKFVTDSANEFGLSHINTIKVQPTFDQIEFGPNMRLAPVCDDS